MTMIKKYKVVELLGNDEVRFSGGKNVFDTKADAEDWIEGYNDIFERYNDGNIVPGIIPVYIFTKNKK